MSPVRTIASWPKGKVIKLHHVSSVLEGNPWQDPVERNLCVYLPPGYSDQEGPYVALWDFAAFTNSGPGHLNWRNQGENLVQRLDRLIHEGEMPPVVVAIPDCYTSLGGNQYVNSVAVGPYADYVVEELIPLLAGQVNVIDRRDGRGIFGKSSGGYGALFHAMNYPETWGAIASHAGDVGFDLVYRPEFPAACRGLAECNGDVLQFLKKFWRRKHPGHLDYTVLMVLAMAASYDPDTQDPVSIRLPFDVHTCELEPSRWAQWLEYDPLNLVEHHVTALQSLHCLYLDVGSRDQYNIQFGTRALSAKLEKLRVSHQFEEYDGTHSDMDYRLDISLPIMANALLSARAAEAE